MKHPFILLLLLLAPSGSLLAQNIAQDQIDFVNGFVNAVSSHNEKKVYRYLDKAYRKEQKAFLGSKQQLLDELFSGEDDGVFVTIPTREIIRIEIAEIVDDELGATYIFRVRDTEHDILASLYLKKGTNYFGFEGARG